MNCFLVMLRHSEDDLPLLVTSDGAEAVDYAKRVLPDDGEDVKATLGIDASTPLCVWVYQFAAGKIVLATLIKEFDEQI